MRLCSRLTNLWPIIRAACAPTGLVICGRLFYKDSAPDGAFGMNLGRQTKPIGPLSHEDVVALLWRGGLVPEWVDIIPWEATSNGLVFQLLCCGRFAEGAPHLYHVKEGYPPFHAPGVWIPPDWESVELDGRFNVNWHLKRN